MQTGGSENLMGKQEYFQQLMFRKIDIGEFVRTKNVQYFDSRSSPKTRLLVLVEMHWAEKCLSCFELFNVLKCCLTCSRAIQPAQKRSNLKIS